MPQNRIVLITAVILVLAAVVLGHFRSRRLMARYHSEQVVEWLEFLSRKIHKLAGTVEHHADPVELARALGRLRVEMRYLEMFIGHHSVRLAALSPAVNLRNVLGEGFHQLWVELDTTGEKLRTSPPPALNERRRQGAPHLHDLGEEVVRIAREPAGSVLWGIPALTGRQGREIAQLLGEVARWVARVAGTE